MWTQKTIHKFSALTLLIVLGLATLYGLWAYVSYFLSAIVLYVLFVPIYTFFNEKIHLQRSLSALLVIFITMVVIVAPLVSISLLTIDQIQFFLQNGVVLSNLEKIILEIAPSVNLQEALQSQISNLTGTISNVVLSLTTSLNYWFVGIMLMYFTLYFLLITDKQTLFELILSYIPFSRENSIKILQEFQLVTNAVLVSNLFMAVIQGGLVGLTFHLAGVQGAIVWTFIAFVISFLPFVGPLLISFPATMVFWLNGDYYGAILMIILSVVINLNETFLRPALQGKMGDIHPMVSTSGFVMGIVLFGMIGVVIGPILLSYFLITLKIFSQEYIEIDSPENNRKPFDQMIFTSKTPQKIISTTKADLHKDKNKQ